MSKATFRVFYDGEALRGSQMDVRELAPALLAFGDLLEHANRVVNDQKSTVAVRVKAFHGGCFGIDFEVVQTVSQQVSNLFIQGGAAREALDLLNLLGINPTTVVLGLIGVLKRTRGRQPKARRTIEKGQTRLEFDDCETADMPDPVADLYLDSGVRESLARAVSPLNNPGIDSFYAEVNGTRVDLATKGDMPSLAKPTFEPVRLPIDEEPQERYFSILSLSFKDDNKWRLTDGNTPFYVKITDAEFLGKVDRSMITFAKGDTLKVKLKTVQMQTDEGLKTEYEAVKILEHRKAPRQLGLLPS